MPEVSQLLAGEAVEEERRLALPETREQRHARMRDVTRRGAVVRGSTAVDVALGVDDIDGIEAGAGTGVDAEGRGPGTPRLRSPLGSPSRLVLSPRLGVPSPRREAKTPEGPARSPSTRTRTGGGAQGETLQRVG